MKKIIHLTDLHIGEHKCGINKNEECSLVFQRIINNIIDRIEDPENHIIVITGDLVEKEFVDGNQPSYEEASTYIQKLLSNDFEILVVPGNHDYGNSGVKADIGLVPIFKKEFYGNKNKKFPIITKIDNIAFIGLDSMQGEFDEEGDHSWGSNGSFGGYEGRGQIELLKNEIENNIDIQSSTYKVVYLHHRPFSYILPPLHTLRRKDRKDLYFAIKGKVDAILFGHRHKYKDWNNESVEISDDELSEVNEWDIPGNWHIPRIYDGGSSTMMGGEYSPHRIIDLSKDPSEDMLCNFY